MCFFHFSLAIAASERLRSCTQQEPEALISRYQVEPGNEGLEPLTTHCCNSRLDLSRLIADSRHYQLYMILLSSNSCHFQRDLVSL